MITTQQMYWLVTLDSILGFFAVLLSAGIAGLFFGIAVVVKYGRPRWPPYASAAVALLAGLVLTFTPTTRKMAAIVVVPRIANNEKVHDVGNRLYELAVEWMDELKSGERGR